MPIIKLYSVYLDVVKSAILSWLIHSRIQSPDYSAWPQGCNAVSSLIANPQCGLKVLLLNKCQLGLDGVVQIIQSVAGCNINAKFSFEAQNGQLFVINVNFVSGNYYLEELNLADNVDLDRHALQCTITEKESKELKQPCHDISKPQGLTCSIEELDPAQQNLEEVNAEYNHLEVADSEEPIREAAASGIDDSCASSCERKSASLDCQSILPLSTAIGMAKTLQLLDLSNNGFSAQETETMFGAWSTSRTGLAQRHIKDNIVHLFVKGTKCCVRPCCRKD